MPINPDTRLTWDREQQILSQLRRYLPNGHKEGHPGIFNMAQMVSACAFGSAKHDDSRREAGLPTIDEVTAADMVAALSLVPQIRIDLDNIEAKLIEAALDRGETFESLGEVFGLTRQGMRQRYQRLLHSRLTPADIASHKAKKKNSAP
ncbi:hypothetical protein LWC34_03135 [Kibdelosporangium philippinense]|uniref:DNA-binding protein n=1 Tax=Kibdelosporangium philippinense TaxID=211113 RepID=A0ABS8Z5J3_9PSEU|nr:hypothetical protein [Kibdelosporangium philippinense]MCE7001833.1 hypothetical protein [Kibdelosporangium philippinense]